LKQMQESCRTVGKCSRRDVAEAKIWTKVEPGDAVRPAKK
jgi:hypothetical protein